MAIEFEDQSGKPRDVAQIEEALAVIRREVVTNFLAKAKDGTPLIPHYIVIIEALRDVISIRKGLSG